MFPVYSCSLTEDLITGEPEQQQLVHKRSVMATARALARYDAAAAAAAAVVGIRQTAAHWNPSLIPIADHRLKPPRLSRPAGTSAGIGRVHNVSKSHAHLFLA